MYMTGRAAVTKTGPNDTSVIVWAISEFFSSFFGILTNIYDIYNCNLRNTQQGGVAATKMGPNNARCVWAISEFFFFFSSFFGILTNVYRIYIL